MTESEKTELKDGLISADFTVGIWGVNKQKMTANNEVLRILGWLGRPHF